jgi:hypothetical protein
MNPTMKVKSVLLLLFFLLIPKILCSQEVVFSYDANGNRISRRLIVTPVDTTQKNSSLNLKKLNNSEELKAKETDESEVKIAIYPNPSKGFLRVDIVNMPIEAKSELRVFTIKGNQILIQKNLEGISEINLSGFKNGTYILKILIDNRSYTYKVVKQN